MDTERILTEGLRRAAAQAPTFDDTLLPAFDEQIPGRRSPRWGWLAAAASVLVVVGLATWTMTTGTPPRTATPAAPPATASVTTPEVTPSAPPALTRDGLRPLVGTTWVAESLEGRILVGLPLAQRPWVRFEADGTLHGHDGCHAFHGTYRAEGEQIAVNPTSVTVAGCGEFAGAGFIATLEKKASFALIPSGLLLRSGDQGDVLTLHALTPTDQAPPAWPMLRFLNNTGQPITSVRITVPGTSVEQRLLARDGSGDYTTVQGDLYRYARVEVRLSDGGDMAHMPADYVGEVPLAPGWYTYVLSVTPLHGPEGAPESALVLGFEQVGRPAGRP